MKKLLYILLLVPLALFPQTQEWSQTYLNPGNGSFSQASFTQETNDGGFIILGTADVNANNKILLIKTNELGDKEWSQLYGEGPSASARRVQQTMDGGFVFSARINYNLHLIKTDLNGNTQWENSYEDYTGSGSTFQTSDGEYIIGTDNSLIKLSQYGEIEWDVIYDWALEGMFNTFGIQEFYPTSDGGYIISGKHSDTGSTAGSRVVFKTNEFGDVQWDITLNGEIYGWQETDYIQQTQDGGYIVCGYTNFNNVAEDFSIIKLDANGTLEWEKNYYELGGQRVYSAKQTLDGGYILCGFTSPDYGYGGVYLVKTDLNGNIEWENIYGQGEYPHHNRSSIIQTSDGGYVVCSDKVINVNTSNASRVIWLFKTDGQGNLVTSEMINFNDDKTLLQTVDLLGRSTNDKAFIPLIDIYNDGSTKKRIIIE